MNVAVAMVAQCPIKAMCKACVGVGVTSFSAIIELMYGQLLPSCSIIHCDFYLLYNMYYLYLILKFYYGKME